MSLRGVFFITAIFLATNISMSTPANASFSGCLTALTKARDAVLREATYAYATLMFPLDPMKYLGFGASHNRQILTHVSIPDISLFSILTGYYGRSTGRAMSSFHKAATEELVRQGIPLRGRYVRLTSSTIALFVSNEQVEVFHAGTAIVIDLQTLFPVGRLKIAADGTFGRYEAIVF
jgi:hypothetical protein